MSLYPRTPPHSPDDWKTQGMQLSKSFSTSSRSTNPGSRSISTASSSGRYNSSTNYENAARTYYIELKKYLVALLAKEAAEGVHPQRASARQKLSKLSNLQFHELAMDVYDELMRRNLNDKFVPFLAVKEDFHPKRNQARQKLATLPDSRFKDLASDVYYELIRRYPNIKDDDGNRPPMPPMSSSSTPTPKSHHPYNNNHGPSPPPTVPASQATTIVPMKGTINVEAITSKDSSDEEDLDDLDDHTEFSDNSPIGKYAPSMQKQSSQPMNKNNSTYSYPRKASIANTIQSSSSPYQHHHNQSSSPSLHNGNNNNNNNNKYQQDESLDSLMADLGNMVISRSQEGGGDNNNNNNNMRNIDSNKRIDDYEQRIHSMSKRIQMLEKENQDLLSRKGSHNELENDKEQMLKSRLQQLQDEYNKLDEQYRILERDHHDQQEIVNTVKQETSQLLNELENLSKENDKIRHEKEQSDNKVRQLTQEIQDWQDKYQRIQIQLKNSKLSNDDDNIPNQDFMKDQHLQPTRTGIISYDYILTYQATIEELLRQARSKTPADVLVSMKKIVMTCKSITEDVEYHENSNHLPSDKQVSLQSLKSPFSNGLQHLVTAAKSHVNGMGLSPVYLLDVAAVNLTSSIVNLVKLLGMTTTPTPISTTTTTTTTNNNNNYNNNSNNHHNADILKKEPNSYSTSNTLPPLPNNQYQPRSLYQDDKKEYNSMNPTQLANYLKKETDQIVKRIQSLLGALRSPQKVGEAYDIITSLINVVTNITSISKETFNATATTGAGLRYRQQGDMVLSDLKACADKLTEIRNSSFTHSPENASANAKRDLAKESYEIAKFVKELINLCES